MAKTILIVEDRQDSRNSIVDALKNSGYQVLEANDGEEAVLMLNTKKVDLLLLDVLLPKKDGVEVLKEIKADKRHKKLKIIIFTASKEAEQKKKKILELGADAFLLKPLMVDEIRLVIKELLK